MVKPGWYILNYHEINWEEGPFINAIGGTYSPDIFLRDVRRLADAAKLVSIQDGLARLHQAPLTEPLVSFWFDDGFVGVRKYALPILQDFGTTAALSVCSRFIQRREMFWRCQLSFLANTDGLRHIRSRLRKVGYRDGLVRDATLDYFSEELRKGIEEVYEKFTRHEDRVDAFRIFDVENGIKVLADNNWVIANHSCAHYPLLEQTSMHLLEAHFEECESYLKELLGCSTQFWVAPFDREDKRHPQALQRTLEASGNRTVVLVGHRANQHGQSDRVLYRCWTPADTSQIVNMLKGLR